MRTLKSVRSIDFIAGNFFTSAFLSARSSAATGPCASATVCSTVPPISSFTVASDFVVPASSSRSTIALYPRTLKCGLCFLRHFASNSPNDASAASYSYPRNSRSFSSSRNSFMAGSFESTSTPMSRAFIITDALPDMSLTSTRVLLPTRDGSMCS